MESGLYVHLVGKWCSKHGIRSENRYDKPGTHVRFPLGQEVKTSWRFVQGIGGWNGVVL